MNTRTAGKIFASTLLPLGITLGLSAQPQGPAGAQAGAPGNGAPIRLRATTFTPTRGERPAVPDAMTIGDYAPGQRGYYIVQFEGPIEDAWKETLAATGADVLDYIPDFALKARMNPREAVQARRLPHVAWVGVFHPAYKIAPDLTRDAQQRLFIVRIERDSDIAAAAGAVGATGARVLQRDDALLTIAATAAQVDAVAHVLDVASIEAFAIRQKHNEYGGGAIMRAGVAVSAGYDGSTQTIGIADTGIGGGTAATAHRDLPASRVAAIYNWPGATSACFESVAADGPIDVDTGHGTHVSTSALGGGDGNGVGRGTAPGSRLVFQAIEDFVIPSFVCQFLLGMGPGYYLAGVPADIGMLFQQTYDAGARVHSNSWGSAANGAYTADAVNTDAFVWAHRDLTVTISAGNAGVDANGDGIVDGGSLMSPATAKNVITVGASEGDRGASYDCDPALPDGGCAARGGQNDVFTYGKAFGGSFVANPLRDDATAGNAEQMAAFSSRGPTTDGRIKPDVVAPGTWILSGYAERFQQYYDPSPNPQSGQYQYDGWGDPLNDKYKYMGGTSMAAPLVAGAAAVVRDYYEKAHGHSASAALVKATLVNAAVDLLDENNDGIDDNLFPIPNIHEGWGRVDLAAATDGTREFVDESTPLTTGATTSFPLTVDATLRPLKVTLAWTDAPSTTTAATHLVNDLDLELIAPDGTTYAGNAFLDGWSVPGGSYDRLNNLENVYVAAPQTGEWTIVVRGFNVPQGPQPFALVMGRGPDVVEIVPRVSVTASDAAATEAGTTTGAFTLTRSGDVSAELAVAYVMSGTSTAGSDYVTLSGVVTFAAGAAATLVEVTPIDDASVEGAETVVLTVVPGPGYGPRAPSSATVVITSDDQPGDLIVSGLAAPATAAGGASIVVTDTTRNQGTSPSTTSETGFYLSTNASLDTADIFLGFRTVPLLAAGAGDSQPTTVTLPAGVAGTYYVIAKADWNGGVPETNEANNTRSSSALRIGPDLLVPTITVPVSGVAGGAIAVADTTRNDGVQTASASTTAFYLSANTALDAADVRLGSHDVPPLATGAMHTVSTTLTLPVSAGVGSYYIIARADDGGAVPESSETNNTKYALIKLGADLLISAVSGPSAAAPGGTISVSDTTRNQGGGGASNFVTGFYLSSNSSLDSSDTRLGDRQITELSAGASVSATTTLTLPTPLPAGLYFLIANADDGKAVVEAMESNNSRVSSTQLKIGPDLFVVSLGAPSTAGAGTSISLTDNVKNIGGAASAAAEAIFYLSANTTLDSTDVELQRRTVPPLGAGVSDAAAIAVTVPPNTTSGTYYVIEHVDPADLVDEASETNNTLRSNAIRIGPDMTLTALTAPSTAVTGSAINVTDTTRNAGGGAAGPSTTAFYLSLNTVVDSADVPLGSRSIGSLLAGASSTAATTLVIPGHVAAGTYYLIATADDGAVLDETSETNNTRRVTVTVTMPTP